MGWRIASLLVVGVSTAAAQPKPKAPAVEGATEVVKLTTPAGFIDEAVAVDGDRFGYVVSDSSSKSELRIVTLATKAEQVVDISGVTLQPVAITLVGQRAFVVGEVDGGKQVAALVELVEKNKKPPGTAVFKVPAATHITWLSSPARIAVHRASSTANGGTKHEVEVLAADSGRRLSMRALELDQGNLDKKLDFRVNHWSDGWTKAHGIKGGEWDRKEDQRSPDTEATYDLVAGKLIDRKKIVDLFEQRKRYQVLADAGGKLDFVKIGWDNTTLQAWRGGKLHKIEIDQPLPTYDPKSLQGAVTAGAVWLALKVDPLNADAVARKKADVEYLDIFRAQPDGKASRKARVLAAGVRHRFGIVGATGDRFWLLERNQSMERGGKTLTVYQLQ
jgi:hypothetical protein